MNDRAGQHVARTVGGWLADGRRVAAATLFAVDGSAPLELGSTMYVAEGGTVEGSITGGCVEAAILHEAEQLLAASAAPKVLVYGVSDELAGTVGLTCGGTVHVLLREPRGEDVAALAATLEALASGRPAALATVVDGEHAGASIFVDGERTLGTGQDVPLLGRNVARDAEGLILQGRSVLRRIGDRGAASGDAVRVQVTVLASPPKMLIVGAIDFSAALARLARPLGYRVTIADPRSTFLRSPRFADVADTIESWPEDAVAEVAPGPRDAVLVFTHDPKLDVPAVRAGLRSGAGFVGALGSRSTTADRNDRLRDAGVGDDELARLHAPCGLDLGGTTIEEAAVSVLAEIIASRHERSAQPLRHGAGAIRSRVDGETGPEGAPIGAEGRR